MSQEYAGLWDGKRGWVPPNKKTRKGWTYYEMKNGKKKEKKIFSDLRGQLSWLKDEIGNLAGPVISNTWKFLNDSAAYIGEANEQRGKMAVIQGKTTTDVAKKIVESTPNPFRLYDPEHWRIYGSPGTTEDIRKKQLNEIYEEWGAYLETNPQPGGGELGDE